MSLQFTHLQILRIPMLLLLSLSITASSPADSRKANEAYKEGNYELAAELYQIAIIEDPQNPQLYFNLGNTYAQLGQVEMANEAFERYKSLTEASSELALADYNIGKMHADQQELEEAVNQFKQALMKNSTDPDARHNYELARKMLQQQSEDEQQEDQQDQNEDQENEDQNQDQQNEPQDEQQDQQDQNSDNQQQDQQQSSQSTQQNQMNMDEAERILEALDQRERDLLRNQQKDAQNASPDNRNW